MSPVHSMLPMARAGEHMSQSKLAGDGFNNCVSTFNAAVGPSGETHESVEAGIGSSNCVGTEGLSRFGLVVRVRHMYINVRVASQR